MAKNVNHIIHLNGSGLTQDNKVRVPSATSLEYGEIAINYTKDYETMVIKNSDNEIVTFSSDKELIKAEQVIAQALNNLNDSVSAITGNINTISGAVSGLPTDIQTVSGAVTGLNETVTGITGDIQSISGVVSGLTGLPTDVQTVSGDLNTLVSEYNADERAISTSLNNLNKRVSAIESGNTGAYVSNTGDSLTGVYEFKDGTGGSATVKASISASTGDISAHNISGNSVSATSATAVTMSGTSGYFANLSDAGSSGVAYVKANTYPQTGDTPTAGVIKVGSGLSITNEGVLSASFDASAIEAEISAITGNVQAVSGVVSGLTGDVNTVSGNVNTVSGNVNTVSGNVNTLSGTVGTLSTDLNTLVTEYNSDERAISIALNDLNARILAIENRLTAIEAALGS